MFFKLCQRLSLTSDSFTPHDKNTKFYKAQMSYRLLQKLYRRLKRGNPAFFGLLKSLVNRTILGSFIEKNIRTHRRNNVVEYLQTLQFGQNPVKIQCQQVKKVCPQITLILILFVHRLHRLH
jgi:hypothetical protein